jgi:serine-type D-Ala-D-Ala carboxypeptidase (penicillin-binding protein 5/6)
LLLASLLLALAASAPLAAGPAQNVSRASSDPVLVTARSAILVDQESGRVLYQHDADEPFVPASLAKLMTLHIVMQKLEDRSISRADVVSLTSNAWADHQAPGSTLMHLGPGHIVTVEELMKGVAIASGNDAATALAEYVAGSVPRFVALMNDEARYMGYTVMRFTDPAGVREDNRVTAREFADFCRRYIALHPGAMAELHSLREFDYPLAQNMPDGRLAAVKTKKQFNGNYLVWDGIGVDGLKTGHLDDENFTAAITARRGDMRLIAVMLGVSGQSLTDGARKRTEDGLTLLRYGFRNYATIALDAPELPAVRVWKGAAREVAMAPSRSIAITVRPEERSRLTCMATVREPLVAPVYKGQRVGELIYNAGSEEVARIPLLAADGVERARLLRRLWDGLGLAMASLWDGASDAARAALSADRGPSIVSTGARSGSAAAAEAAP